MASSHNHTSCSCGNCGTCVQELERHAVQWAATWLVDVKNQRRLLAWDPTKNAKVSSIFMDKGNYHRIFRFLPKLEKQVICSELVQAWKVLTGGSCKASNAFPLRSAPYFGDLAPKCPKDILSTKPYDIPSAQTVLSTELCIMPQNHGYFYPAPEFLSFSPPNNSFHSSHAQLSGQSGDPTVVSYSSHYYLCEQYRSLPNSFYDLVEEAQTLVRQSHPTTSRRQSKRRKFRRPAATRIATSSGPQSFTMINGQDKGKSGQLASDNNNYTSNNNSNVTTTTAKLEVNQSKLNPAAAIFVPTVQQQQQPATEAPSLTNANLVQSAPAMVPTRFSPVVVVGTRQNGEWPRLF